MNTIYKNSLIDIENALYKLNKLYDAEIKNSMEDKEAYYAICKAVEVLEDAKNTIEHYSKPSAVGVLREDSNGKFCVEFPSGNSYTLSCGNSIELYLKEDAELDISEGWHAGRVEHNGKGYYFYPYKTMLLYEGMRARIRE